MSTQAQHLVRQKTMEFVASHPWIAVRETDLTNGVVGLHVHGATQPAEEKAVDELAALFGLEADVQLDDRYATLNWRLAEPEDIDGFPLQQWTPIHDGDVVVWAGRAMRPHGPCGTWPCSCVKPSPTPGTGA